jgi:hypothetical protein
MTENMHPFIVPAHDSPNFVIELLGLVQELTTVGTDSTEGSKLLIQRLKKMQSERGHANAKVKEELS